MERAQEYRRQQAGRLRSLRADSQAEAGEYGGLRQEPFYQQARRLVTFNRWEKQAQKTPEFLKETWEEAADAFSGACNNGVKAWLWIEIAQRTNPGTYISIKDLFETYSEIFAQTQLLEAAGSNAKGNMVGYCQESLYSVGLVARKFNIERQTIGFGITEMGQKYLDAACLTLWWENHHQQSLYPLLGKTGSSGDNRSPITRARILDYLMRHSHQVREVDLVTNLQLYQNSTKEALKLFNGLGLAEYRAVTSHTAKVPLQYERKEGKDLREPGYFNTGHGLQDEVVLAIEQLASNSPRFSIADIVDKLPEGLKARWGAESLKSNVSLILSGFAQREYLLRVDNFKGGEKQSDVSLTSKGWSFGFGFIWPVLAIFEGRSLTAEQQAEQRARIELARKNLDKFARTSAELYYPHSHSFKIRAKAENLGRIVEALAKGDQTAGELAEITGVSAQTVRNYLAPHVEGSELVIIEVGGKAVRVGVKDVKGVNHYSFLGTLPR